MAPPRVDETGILREATAALNDGRLFTLEGLGACFEALSLGIKPSPSPALGAWIDASLASLVDTLLRPSAAPPVDVLPIVLRCLGRATG